MSTIGFLHTSPVHTTTFERLVRQALESSDSSGEVPAFDVVSAVDESLLADARRHGVEQARLGVRRELQRLSDAGVVSVVCTCSTIGDLAEQEGERIGLAVSRVDRPMVERAVELGGHIVVLVAVDSTIEPTRQLFDDVVARRVRTNDRAAGSLNAAESATQPHIEMRVVDGAWDRFEAEDLDGYYRTIADEIRLVSTVGDVGRGADVIVLAQASMEPAAALAGELPIPVLTSPRLAVESAINQPSMER